uniref:Si:ch211-141e20.2 n=1 Tax=Cyprinus carpio TaxID=7962 RepID=A0A8C2IHV7_CYPCA
LLSLREHLGEYLHVKCVKVIGNDATVIYEENITLSCQLTDSDDQLTRIIWKKKTRENPEEKFFFSIRSGDKTEHSNGLGNRVQFIGNFAEKNGSIQLLRMRLLDEGIYTCIFNLINSGPFETNINATVFGMMACLCNSNVQCVVNHKTLGEELVLNYTIDIHCK